ncbi:hypothetical protein [Pseudothauera rhizosphaerae]|uniref:Uncharacterized protein n=1 Tax=Pseudothauera rhizosphaerae TaxID=2565932 RepID=A0A4S4AET1_9RHOO|nr:hypothetical protein [Pseudothauera rhizosphaerae]THF57251.1 hypothetical protein E6O51_18310 [Pseudothauera rhizosphaerae]
MTCYRDRSRRWGIATMLLASLAAAPASAADWQEASAGPQFVALVDTASIARDDGRVSAWVWYQPVRRGYWTWLFRRDDGPRLQADIKERASVDCRARSYLVHDFEGSPLSGRHLGRAAEVVPGSAEEAVLAWLCRG